MGNRFDLLRLAAALSVFVAHGDFLYRLHLPVPFPGHSLGSLAVYVFFFVSGYLVCQSWMREPIWRVFWLKRVMRIFPGLVVAVAFSVFVLGWAVTSLSSSQYLSASGTWLNFVNNAFGLATVQTLPGVFETNPFARAVNGSLWTIRYELSMYLVLAILAWCTRGHRWVYPLGVLLLGLLWQMARTGGWDTALAASNSLVAQVFRWRDFCGFGVPFFLGATMAMYALRPQAWIAAAAVLALIVAWAVDAVLVRQLAVWVLIACGTFYAAHAGAAAGHGRWQADLSYGVYIYAFPVQQAMTELSLRHGWSMGACMLLSLASILALALVSWYGVERPCIAVARRWARSVRPAASS